MKFSSNKRLSKFDKLENIDGEFYKICGTCKLKKKLEEYHKSKKYTGGVDNYCKDCAAIRQRNNISQARARDYFRKYGITEVDYNLMYLNQSGKCLICDTFKELLRIDHNHFTNKVRGLLCEKCNLGLGFFQDNILFLQNAIGYLKK